MTQSNHKIAFRVRVFHSYFENNICNCLRFKAGPKTLQLLTRFGFNIRYEPNGFDFFADTNASLGSLLNYISKATGQASFDFEIESANGAFTNFTEMPAG